MTMPMQPVPPSQQEMMNRQQMSELIELQRRTLRRSRLISNILHGAMLATLFAGIFVFLYLILTSSRGTMFGTPLIEYILGTEYNSDVGEQFLFIVIARFLTVFSILWAPMTFVSLILTAVWDIIMDR
jgi:uncharacterized membrane-anchored protein YitT (DUF2179 family)